MERRLGRANYRRKKEHEQRHGGMKHCGGSLLHKHWASSGKVLRAKGEKEWGQIRTALVHQAKEPGSYSAAKGSCCQFQQDIGVIRRTLQKDYAGL